MPWHPPQNHGLTRVRYHRMALYHALLYARTTAQLPGSDVAWARLPGVGRVHTLRFGVDAHVPL